MKWHLSFALILSLLFLGGISITGWSQNIICGEVRNTQNQLIPFVNIANLHVDLGVATDSLGKFVLPVTLQNQQFKVSSIGYEPTIVTTNQLLSNSTIVLKPLDIILEQVSVVAEQKKFKKIAVGYKLKKNNYYLASMPGNQFATKIECPKELEGSNIESVSFLVAKTGVCHSPLRLRVLEVNSIGSPGQDVVFENIIIKQYNKETFEIVIIDLTQYSLIMPAKGVYLSIEWLDKWTEPLHEGNKTLFCTDDYIKAHRNSTEVLPSPAIAMGRHKASFSWRNYRNKQWHPVNEMCRLNMAVVLRKIL